ncbi:hypothetical protein GGH95_000609 [Coemansia sp. RSA 1836]|nr:hypothetical protein GGH95_000609 [Coemansia sp. RSA 1836]
MSLDKIQGLGRYDDVTITSTEDYDHYLRRNMLHPLRSLFQNTQSTVLAIVANFTPATRSNGTDWKMAIRVTNPTLGARDTITWITFRELHQMPAVHNAGDIVYLEGVKVQQFNGRCQLLTNYASRWEIVPVDRDVSDLHPMVRYLREWWTSAAQLSEPSARPQPVAYTDPGARPPLPPAVCAGTSTKSKYFKQVFELSESTRFVELLIELLHIRDSDRPNVRRCLVTDYTENNLLQDIVDISTYPRVPGKRLMWCTIGGDIPGMPELLANHYYRLRGAKVVVDRFDCLHVAVERDTIYPNKKLVNEVHESLPELWPLLKRRAKCVGGGGGGGRVSAEAEEKGDGGAVERPVLIDTTKTKPTTLVAPPPPAMEPEFLGAEITRIGEIIGDQQTLGMRYHVRAQIVDVYPDSARDSITKESEIRVVLEVADNSGSCLVLCQGTAAAEFVGLGSANNLGDKLTALLPIWDMLDMDDEDRPWLDLCVASFLVPGPGEADGRRPLTRCLALASGSLK